MKKYAAIAALFLVASPADADPFEKNLSLQGLTFHVASPNDSSTSKLRLSVDGLKAPAPAIEREIDGIVIGAEIADLDANGFPEIYVFTQSAGSGSYGNIVAYASNKNRSITEIFLPELKKREAKGYQGHDEFAIVEQYVVRRFPIYRAEDANATPTGGQRQIQYRLRPGEAGWILRQVKTTEIPPGR